METLTYPYGETPEEVIRERLAAVFAPTGETNPFEVADAMVNWSGYADDPADAGTRADFRDFLAAFVGIDHLLTVLDALKAKTIAAQLYRKQEFDYAVEPPNSFASGRLRISILAALGIKES